ncbi:MAG: hypothetical protein Q9165_004996 [Trypethelium subeluteriae]
MSSPLYEALSLGDSGNSIRLLTLEPNKESRSRVVCHIHAARISDKPQYEALSYCWGYETSSEKILIHHNELTFETTVKNNLLSALRALRHKKTERVLWIDAISIDQNNLEEKKQQVPLMKAIFSNCTGVMAWLGESDDDSKKVFSEIQKKSKSYPRKLVKVLRRPWFRRVWIIQEVALAPKVLIQCGDSIIMWHQLMEYISLVHYRRLQFNPFDSPDAKHFHPAFYPITMDLAREKLQDKSGFSLREALRSFQPFKATEILDKIYSVEGLLQEPSLVDPDYTESAETVYQNAAVSIIRREKRVDLFLDCFQRTTASRVPDLPSWVPDWSSIDQIVDNPGSFVTQEEVFCASQETCVDRLELLEDRELVVSGMIIGSIAELGRQVPTAQDLRHRYWPGILTTKRPFDIATEAMKIFQSWRNVARLPRIGRVTPEAEKYLTGEPMIEVFYCTLFRLGAVFPEADKARQFTDAIRLLELTATVLDWYSRNILQRLPWFAIWPIVGPLMVTMTFVILIKAFRGGFAIQIPDGPPDASRHGWVPGRTDSGLFGSFPAPDFTAESGVYSLVGDVIVLFKGGARPFIIRPCQNGRWHLIGSAYIHGIMFGGAFEEEKCIDIHLI